MRLITLSLLLLAGCFVSNASPIDVSYTVSGISGAWDLNFTVTNNMTAWPTQDIYEFGVLLSGPGITGSPTGYNAGFGATNTNTSGGPDVFYNNYWYDFADLSLLLAPHSLSGFVVTVADVDAPTSVAWFALSVENTFGGGSLYSGSEAFNIDTDSLTAGFNGEALAPIQTAADTPEASPLGLVAVGLAICIFLRRKPVRC